MAGSDMQVCPFVRSASFRRLIVQTLHPFLFFMGAITPFVVLLLVALIFNYIPMDGQLKRIGYILIGIIALVLLLRFAGIL